MEQSNEKACMECGDSFRGRSDKKFCCDQCRNTYNNRCTQESNGFIRGINHILRKNRKILEELIPGDVVKVNKRKLYERGFNFEFTTSTITAKDGRMYSFCYEFGYVMLNEEQCQLVKRTDREDEWFI